MIDPTLDSDFGVAVRVTEAPAEARVLVVCEHARNHVPAFLRDLGVDAQVLQSHVAWDPGAFGLAQKLADRLSAPLVSGEISRLVYDCNRPPEAADAIPAQSEIHAIPGNAGLSDAARTERVRGVYDPFRTALAAEIASRRPRLQLMVTVHSFTPVYHGRRRSVELGILHGRDPRMAQAMMAARPAGTPFDTRLNEPYSAADGVAHTLNAQGVPSGLHTVMLELRNDLIATEAQQTALAALLAPWLMRALASAGNFAGPA